MSEYLKWAFDQIVKWILAGKLLNLEQNANIKKSISRVAIVY